MVNILSEPAPDTLAIQVTGKLNKKDYNIILPVLESKIGEFGKINLLVEVDDMKGMSSGAVWEEVRFDAEHINDFKRVAVVGDEHWLEWTSKFADPFTPAQIRYFNKANMKEATDWVLSDN